MMIERAAWIGGADGVSNTCAPPGMPVVGTMPHAMIMCFDKPEDAWRAFDRDAPAAVPRIMLCDTYCDEKTESLKAAECGATAVRLDTPRSRRGDMRSIIEEVRWELDSHGYSRVKIFLSGGVTREDVIAYRDCVDAFGIGGAIANAPVIDFAMDIVEIEKKPKAKRGKRSGIKQVYELVCEKHRTLPVGQVPPANAVPLLKTCIVDGRIVQQPDMQEARKRVLAWIRHSTEATGENKEPAKKNGKNGSQKKPPAAPKALPGPSLFVVWTQPSRIPGAGRTFHPILLTYAVQQCRAGWWYKWYYRSLGMEEAAGSIPAQSIIFVFRFFLLIRRHFLNGIFGTTIDFRDNISRILFYTPNPLVPFEIMRIRDLILPEDQIFFTLFKEMAQKIKRGGDDIKRNYP